jgi:outer membrane protein assembly factor BamD
MKRLILHLVATAVIIGIFTPVNCPAPLVWRRGEGWSYESTGVTWGNTPKEQLDICRQLQNKGDYGSAASGYRRLLKRWPTSMFAAEARLGLAECYTARGYHYKAFRECQNLVTRHPGSDLFDKAIRYQFEAGNLFMAGERDKAMGIRTFPSYEKAIEIFQQVLKNAPFSEVGPPSQFHIGLTYEKQKEYVMAVNAYEKLLERYPRHELAEVAQFQIGLAYRKQAARAEYDQNAANQAIAAFTEYIVRYPSNEKAALAEQYRGALKSDQSRGLFEIGHYYEKRRNATAALIYYNEVLEQNPQSEWAERAQAKIVALTPPTPPPATATP